AIEDPQRVPGRPRAAILVELVDERLEVPDQLLAVGRAAVLVSDRVEVELVRVDAALLGEPIAEDQHVDVGTGTRDADHLHPELPELAEAAGLRTVVPEMPTHVIRLE